MLRGMIRRAIPVLFALLASLLAPSAVLADAELVTSTPEAGSTVTELAQVVLTFDEPLNADRSSIVLRAGGTRVAAGGVDAGDATRMVVQVLNAQAGDYEVRYTAASQDGHLVRDTFTFTLSEPVATASAEPPPPASATAAPTASATATPPGTASPPPVVSPVPVPSAGSPGTAAGAGTDVVVPIVAALALIGVAGAWLFRRRSG
jgi:MYXO-CTERM domain-containing protein